MRTIILLVLVGSVELFGLTGCGASSVPVSSATLGEPVSRTDLLEALANPVAVNVEKRTVAHWAVPLSGLLNLEHPKAQAAGIEDREEPIDLFVYVVRHPEQGTFIIDSGVSALFLEPDGNPNLSGIVSSAMGMEKLEVLETTASIADTVGGVDGVFLTHIHIDHIMGLNDLPADTAVYIGPGDASAKAGLNALTQGTTDRLLGTQNQLREWPYGNAKILDIFGDGSVFAIHSPGHTPGATAYLVNSVDGAHLMLGDATHTRWGWENGVEPGSYSADIPTSAESLAWLKELSAQVPAMTVHPGHQ